MIKRIKCLFKGHQFMMQYNFNKLIYSPSASDKCICCNKKRGVNLNDINVFSH